MAPENKDLGSAPTVAALARGFGSVAASVAQTLVRAAGEVISAVAAVVKSPRAGSRASSSAEPALGLRAIVGGAAARARRKQEIARVGEPTPHQASAPFSRDDDGAFLDADLDEDTMVALPRDPQSLYAYWHLGEVSRARREELLRYGSGLLRDALLLEVENDDLHDGAPGVESFVVPLPLLAESCHVDLGRPRARARVFLGLHNEDSGFTPLAAAPAISLPPSGCGDVAAPRWRRLPFGREHAGEPPIAPRREASDLLAARAREHDRASSETSPRAHDAGAPQRDAVVGRPT